MTDFDQLVREHLPPPVVDALEAERVRQDTTMKQIVKDALYSYAAKLVIDKARADGLLTMQDFVHVGAHIAANGDTHAGSPLDCPECGQ